MFASPLSPRIAIAAAAATLFSCSPPLPTSVSAESWTDLRGTRTIEADLVGMFGDQVFLRLADGRRVAVRLDQLRAESRLQAQDLIRKRAQVRADRIAELRRQADVAAAPAPETLPEPEPAAAYQPPSENLSAVDTMRFLDQQMRNGHLIALYDFLPETYRDQVDQLVAQASLKLAEPTWNSLTGAVHEIGDLVVTHQNWFFSHPRLKLLEPQVLETIRDPLLDLAGFLRSGFDPEQIRLRDLQTMAFRDWLLRWDEATADYLAALSKAGGDQPWTYEETGKRGDTVTVRATRDEATIDFQMKPVEGHWVFAELADRWPQFVEDAQAKLDEMPDGSLDLGLFAEIPRAIVTSQTQPLRQAGDAATFHRVMDAMLDEAMPSIQPMLAGIPEMLGIAGGPGRGGPGGYGMDSGYEMDAGYGYGEAPEMYGEGYEDPSEMYGEGYGQSP